jgi:hypothetical protein
MQSFAQLRVVSYNCAGLKGDPNALRDVLTAIALDDKPGFAVAPHILVFQEVPSSKVAQLETIVDSAVAGLNYVRGTFTSSGSEDSAGGAQAVFYRSDLVTEIVASHMDLDTGGGRKTDRWQFQLVGYTSSAARFYLYGSHLKASPGPTNEAERLAGAQTIRNNSDLLPLGTHILYCGDFNLYSNTEPAYLEFLSAGAGQAFDPLGTGSWSGSGNAAKHTQSPRDIVADGLVGGGLDDRFDFQISTAEFQDGEGLSIIAGTYRALGNDGQHYNTAINAGNNFFYPGQLARSNALADALFDATDHIPVVVDYRIPGMLSASINPSIGKVIQGAPVVVNVSLQNIAAGLPVGIDPLSLDVDGGGALAGGTMVIAPLAPASAVVPLSLNTSTIGTVNGSVFLTPLSEGAQVPATPLATTAKIVRPSNASFAAGSNVDAITVVGSAPQGSPSIEFEVPLYNFGFDANQALLDIDGIANLGGGFTLTGGTQTGIGGVPAEIQFSFDAMNAAPGTYTRTVQISVSDENIPGAASAVVSLTLEATIETSGIPADLDGNGVVNGADLAILLGQWGIDGTADLDGSGAVDGADLAILLGSWI